MEHYLVGCGEPEVHRDVQVKRGAFHLPLISNELATDILLGMSVTLVLPDPADVLLRISSARHT